MAIGQDEHGYDECDDPDCPRYPCKVYREGRERGYREGFAEGEAVGFAAGYAAGVADASPG